MDLLSYLMAFSIYVWTIVAVSANAFEEDVRKSLSAGMNAHVAKPIDVNTLFESMKKLAGC